MFEPIKILLLSLREIDPLLHDGATRTLIERLRALHNKGCKVLLSNFLPKSDLNQYIIQRMILSEVVREKSKHRNFSHAPLLGVEAYHELLPFGFNEINSSSEYILGRLLQHIDRFRPDFIITVDTGFLPLVAACLAEIPGAHSFHSLQNIQWFESKPDYIRLLNKRRVICNSEFSKSEIQSRLKIQAHVWHSYVNFSDLLGKEEVIQTLPDKRIDIGFCSGHPVKGDALVARIADRMPERSFLIVGEYCSDSLKNRGNVALMGFINDMKNFYSQIKVILVPSFVLESFPRVVLEVSAFGLPVVANRVGGIPEALGDSGIMVDIDVSNPYDLDRAAEEYVHYIQNLLDNPALHEAYQHKALERVKQHKIVQDQEAPNILKNIILPSIAHKKRKK